MNEFYNSLGLLISSRDTALHLSDENECSGMNPMEQGFEKNSWSLHKEVKIARLHQQIRFYITYLLTLSGRFRVGFGVGDISNKIEH